MRAEVDQPPDIEDFARDYVNGAKPRFTPYAKYSQVADAVFVYTKDEPAFHKRVDGMFTILYSENREFLGCIVKSIKSLWDDAPPGSATFEAVFERYVTRNPKVIWRFNKQDLGFNPQDLGPVVRQEVALT